MKRFNLRKSLFSINLAAAMMMAGTAFAQSNPAAAGLASVSIGNSIKGGVSVGQIGSSSESNALNTQTSTASMATNIAQSAIGAAASFSGKTVQTGSNQVWNAATGPNAQGYAQSADSNKAGTLGAANVGDIGAVSATNQPFVQNGVNLTVTGISGDLATAGTSSVAMANSNFAGTNQGIATATNAQATVGGQLAASTGGAIAANGNTITLTGTTTGDVAINTAQGNITLKTGGVNGDGSPATMTLSGGTNSIQADGSFGAGMNGSGAVIAYSGTGAALGDLIQPAIGELVSPGSVKQGIVAGQ